MIQPRLILIHTALFALIGFLNADSANANLWWSNIFVTNDVACVGLDGIPLTVNAGECCVGGNLKPEVLDPNSTTASVCRTGFGKLAQDATVTTTTLTTIGKGAMSVADALDGGTNEYDSGVGTPTPPPLSGSGAESSAIKGSASNSGGGGLLGTGFNPFGMFGSGAGSGAGGGSGAGAGSGGGASGGVGKAGALSGGQSKNKKGDELASKESASGYTRGDGSAGSGGAGGAAGSGSGDAAKYSADQQLDGLKFGEDENAAAAGDAKLGDEDGTGSSNDPSDYFNRIHPSANLFKIVTARYQKKKTLYKAGLEIREAELDRRAQ